MTRRALVCEDDFSIRLLLEAVLTRYGLTVESVATGVDAVARLRREHYELVLLDLLLPVMSGYEVIDLLRHERPELLSRVVVVTAVRQASREALPVAAVIRKPFDLADLGGVITRIVFPWPDSSRHDRYAELQ